MARQHIFIQDTGIYTDDVLVVVGVPPEAAIEWCQKQGVNKKFIALIKDGYTKEAFEKLQTAQIGQTHISASNGHAFLLALRAYKENWEFWEVLIHEAVHVMQCVRIRKGMKEEHESEAYLVEHLFHNIRRKIQNNHSVYKKDLTKTK